MDYVKDIRCFSLHASVIHDSNFIQDKRLLSFSTPHFLSTPQTLESFLRERGGKTMNCRTSYLRYLFHITFSPSCFHHEDSQTTILPRRQLYQTIICGSVVEQMAVFLFHTFFSNSFWHTDILIISLARYVGPNTLKPHLLSPSIFFSVFPAHIEVMNPTSVSAIPPFPVHDHTTWRWSALLSLAGLLLS